MSFRRGRNVRQASRVKVLLLNFLSSLFISSGLISEVLRRVEELRCISSNLSISTRILFSRSFQEAAWSQLRDKLEISLSKDKVSSSTSTRIGKNQLPEGELEKEEVSELCQDVKHVVISGGVASNLALREA